jgi:hypothetical protein
MLNPFTRTKTIYNLTKLAWKYNRIKQEKSVPNDIKIVAQFAEISYSHSRPDELHGLKLDQELSTRETAIYANDQIIIISFRGTDNKTDILVADLQIALSSLDQNSSRVKSALKLTREVMKKYLRYSYLLTGHSLGGSICDIVSSITGIPAHTFNIGASVNTRSECKLCIHHVIKSDPISNSAIGFLRDANIMVYDKQIKNLNPHTIKQFL